MNKHEKNQPAFEFRLNHIRVTVWENVGTDGKSWFNTSITRRYQDSSHAWKEAATFNGLADLALVAEAVRSAQEFVRRVEIDRQDASAAGGGV